jgi:hypothetical protein
MTMKIDDLNLRYTVPGQQPELNGLAEADDLDTDREPAPFSHVQQFDAPLPGEWKELLGLTVVSPGPIRIDPPTRPASQEVSGRSEAEIFERRFLQANRPGMSEDVTSPKLQRMLDLLVERQRSTDGIRARALDGGYR